MTAFARFETQVEQGLLVWELYSVNHRYLHISLHLDPCFQSLEFEMKIRKLLTDKLARGSINARLSLHTSTQKQLSTISIDNKLAKSVIDHCDDLAGMAKQAAPTDILQVMRWPGVLRSHDIDEAALNDASMMALGQAVNNLIAMRAKEGGVLQKIIIKCLLEIDNIVTAVSDKMPAMLEDQRQRLADRVAALQVAIDPDRLEQEIAILAQKSDVTEELDRLRSHVAQMNNILQCSGAPVGRRLDFLTQELNREANTLAAKSMSSELNGYAVELKILIDKMREQIQNIE